MMSQRRRQPRRRGLTIVEVVISVMIVGLVMVSAMDSVGQILRGRQQTADAVRAKALAQQLMTEILRDAYEDDTSPVFGPESGESGGSRADWDDVDDYDGWSQSPPEDHDGNTLPNLSGWQRDVVVEFVDPADPASVSGTDQGVKRVTVSVSRNGVTLAREVSLRTDQYQVSP